MPKNYGDLVIAPKRGTLWMFSFQLMLNDSDLKKAAEEMMNDAHDEV